MKQLFNMRTLVFAASLMAVIKVDAQDYHLSHYDAAPLYLNPGLTGMSRDIKGDYRITTDFRSQWKSLGIKSFKTFYAGYDQEIRNKDDRYGVGGYIINHRGGVGQFNSFSLMASGAYDISKGKRNPHILRTGLQIGLLNKSYNSDNFTFNEQYNTSTGDFDQGIDNQEDLQKASIFRFDAAVGVYYKYVDPKNEYIPSLGVALHHVTLPNESFTSFKSRLPIRYVFHTECKVVLTEDWAITPKVLFMYQGGATEINLGLQGSYIIDDNFTVLPAVSYRHKDAIVADLAFQFGNNFLRFSYDINTSYLKQFTGGRGAFEVSLILIGNKGEPLVPFKKFF